MTNIIDTVAVDTVIVEATKRFTRRNIVAVGSKIAAVVVPVIGVAVAVKMHKDNNETD